LGSLTYTSRRTLLLSSCTDCNLYCTCSFIVSEAVTGVNWYDAGYVELQNPSYFGFQLPWNLTTLIIVEVLAMGFVEVARNRESDVAKRCYPGGFFDPLKLAEDKDEDEQFKLYAHASVLDIGTSFVDALR